MLFLNTFDSKMEVSVLLVVLLGYILNDTYHELNDSMIGGGAVEGGVS